MHKAVSWLAGAAIAMLVLGGPPLYHWHQNQCFRNFRVVRPGVLYRSGQLSQDGLERICHDYGIRTVISLRDAHTPGMPPPDRQEEEYCHKMDIYHFRMPPKCWTADCGVAPADENVREFLSIMDNPKYYPVLIHCFAGTHRTGAYCCVYRLEYEHWDRDTALEELHACGYEHLYEEENVLTYLQNYEPRWKQPAPRGE
jgi:tyrosine-protein phosphatase SIW14